MLINKYIVSQFAALNSYKNQKEMRSRDEEETGC